MPKAPSTLVSTLQQLRNMSGRHSPGFASHTHGMCKGDRVHKLRVTEMGVPFLLYFNKTRILMKIFINI